MKKETTYYDSIWKNVVKAKIENQAKAYYIMTDDRDGAEKKGEFSLDILMGDKSNREAHAAKSVF